MLVVLSPAKTLTIDAAARAAAATTPRFIKDADALAASLGRLSAGALSSLFGVSSAIGTLNAARFHSWSSALDGSRGAAAGLAMDGPAFKALDVRAMSISEAESASQRVVILSGMYGLLRIFDGIQPYRLEMGTSGLARHCVCPDASDTLYKFWGPRIARALEEELQHHPRSANTPPVIVNAASQEYWRAVQEQLSPGTRVVTVLFPGPSVYAKMARGAIARFVATRALDSPDGLKDFTGSGNEWSFDARASTGDVYVFKRGGSKKADTKTISSAKVKVEALRSSSAKKSTTAPRNVKRATASAKMAASAKSPAIEKITASSGPHPALKSSISKVKAPKSTAPAAEGKPLTRTTRSSSLNKNTLK